MEITHHRSLPGQPVPSEMAAGDLILVYDHKPTLVHELIQARERQECGNTEWANLTHAVCCLSSDGTIAEELSQGFVENHVSKYDGSDYWLVHFDLTQPQRDLSVIRWVRQLGTPYDYAAFVGEFLRAWGFKEFVATANCFICSAAWAFGSLSWVVSYTEPFEVITPAGLAMKFNLPLGEEPKPLTFVSRLLNRVAASGTVISWPVRQLLAKITQAIKAQA